MRRLGKFARSARLTVSGGSEPCTRVPNALMDTIFVGPGVFGFSDRSFGPERVRLPSSHVISGASFAAGAAGGRDWHDMVSTNDSHATRMNELETYDVGRCDGCSS
jgi:hypothetical protein